MKRIFLICFAAMLTMAFTSAAEKRLNVVCTLPDLGAIAHAVGGDLINITTLAGPSEDAHFVDPRPSFARVLNKADLLVEGGAELESGWLPPLLQNARNAKILPGQSGHFNAAQGIALKDKPTGPIDRSQGDVHAAGNPHYLMDPENAVIASRALATRLGQLDTAHSSEFNSNAQKFAERIKTQMAEWQKSLAAVKGQKAIVYHTNFTYFLDRFGLALFDALEPKPGVEPSPAHIAGLIKRAKAENVKLIMIEENRPRKTPERVAQEIGGKVAVLHHMPPITGADRYITWMNGMIDAVVNAAK
jgi:zinc/manganese transport system substrate-binding protein